MNTHIAHGRDRGSVTSPITERCEVLVIGAGPAGLAAAAGLARLGIDVLVVEKHSGTSPFPKATGVSARTMEIFRMWGIEDRIRAGAIAVDPVLTIRHTLIEPAVMTMPFFGHPTEEQARKVSPTAPCCCPQDHLEPVLVDLLAERGGRVRFGERLTGLEQTPAHVRVTTMDEATGCTRRIQARYVIGADGPHSSVRAAVGIGVEDLGRLGDFFAVTFRADLTRRLRGRPGGVNAVEVEGAEGVFVPTGPGDRWVYAREWFPGTEPVQDWSTDRCSQLIRTASGVPDLEPEILSVMPFVMGGHLATSFRANRVLLVGDAAHRTTPVGGSGMNMAIQAAHNLAWKLAWVVRGWAHPSLLDTYESERRSIGRENVLRSLQRGPALGDAGGPDAAVGGSDGGGVGDLQVRYCLGPDGSGDDDLVGARAPHGWVTHRGRRHSTLDLFEGRITLITRPAGEAWRRWVRQVPAAGMPIDTITVSPRAAADLTPPPGMVVDVDGTLDRLLGPHPDGAVLVRPDGHVAWRFPGSVGRADRTDQPGRDRIGELAAALDRACGWSVRPQALRTAG